MRNQENIAAALKAMKDSWPSPIVARGVVKEFSGGLVSPGTLANEDSRGTGPEGRFQIGGKVAYPIEGSIKWLEGKAAQTKPHITPRRTVGQE